MSFPFIFLREEEEKKGMTINGVESHGGYIVTCNIHMIFMSDSAVGFYNLTFSPNCGKIPRFFFPIPFHL